MWDLDLKKTWTWTTLLDLDCLYSWYIGFGLEKYLECLTRVGLILKRLIFLKIVFYWRGVNLTPTPSYFKNNLSNLNITSNNWLYDMWDLDFKYTTITLLELDWCFFNTGIPFQGGPIKRPLQKYEDIIELLRFFFFFCFKYYVNSSSSYSSIGW